MRSEEHSKPPKLPSLRGLDLGSILPSLISNREKTILPNKNNNPEPNARDLEANTKRKKAAKGWHTTALDRFWALCMAAGLVGIGAGGLLVGRPIGDRETRVRFPARARCFFTRSGLTGPIAEKSVRVRRPGIEPGSTDRRSVVLPLDYLSCCSMYLLRAHSGEIMHALHIVNYVLHYIPSCIAVFTSYSSFGWLSRFEKGCISPVDAGPFLESRKTVPFVEL